MGNYHTLTKVRLKKTSEVLYVEYTKLKCETGELSLKLSDGRHYDIKEVECLV